MRATKSTKASNFISLLLNQDNNKSLKMTKHTVLLLVSCLATEDKVEILRGATSPHTQRCVTFTPLPLRRIEKETKLVNSLYRLEGWNLFFIVW